MAAARRRRAAVRGRLAYPVAAVAAGVISGRAARRRRLAAAGRCGPAAATSASTTRCSTATSASSCSRCRCTSRSSRWLLETLVVGGGRDGRRVRRRGRPAVRARARARAPARPGSARCSSSWPGATGSTQFALAAPARRARPGPDYTDAHVRLPALRVLACVSLAGAALLPVRRRAAGAARPLAAVAALAALRARARHGVVPAVVERFDVAPQALARERPYVERRDRSDSARLRARPRRRARRAPAAQLSACRHRRAPQPRSRTCRCGTRGVLRPAMNELQSIGRYYSFPSLDRRPLHGRRRAALMTVAARQLDLRAPGPGRARLGERPLRLHPRLRRRGGAGAARPTRRRPALRAARVPLAAEPARPARAARSTSASAPAADPPYLVVEQRPRRGRAPVPGSRRPTTTTTAAAGSRSRACSGGPRSRSRFGDLKLLLTETVTDRSRIVLHRDVQRAAAHAGAVPALGRRIRRPWSSAGACSSSFHGYTTSEPLSVLGAAAAGGTRSTTCARGAVAAVDAFSGRVSTLRRRRGDPILRAWRGAFPGLFRRVSQMPDELRAHLRYPRRLFDAQAEVYATYHADDADRRSGTARTPGSAPQQLAGSGRGRRRDPLPRRADADRSTPTAGAAVALPARAAPGRRGRALAARHAVHARAGARTSSATSPARSTRRAGRSSRC